MYLVLRLDDVLIDRFDCNGYNNTEVFGVYSSLDKAREVVLNNIYDEGMLNSQYRSSYRENLGWYWESPTVYEFVAKETPTKAVLKWHFEGNKYDQWDIYFAVYELEIDKLFSILD